MYCAAGETKGMACAFEKHWNKWRTKIPYFVQPTRVRGGSHETPRSIALGTSLMTQNYCILIWSCLKNKYLESTWSSKVLKCLDPQNRSESAAQKSCHVNDVTLSSFIQIISTTNKSHDTLIHVVSARARIWDASCAQNLPWDVIVSSPFVNVFNTTLSNQGHAENLLKHESLSCHKKIRYCPNGFRRWQYNVKMDRPA